MTDNERDELYEELDDYLYDYEGDPDLGPSDEHDFPDVLGSLMGSLSTMAMFGDAPVESDNSSVRLEDDLREMGASIKTQHTQGRQRIIATFDNGFQASIIRGPFTYGGDRGLWELGVMVDGKLTYDTPITSDVIGHMTHGDVLETCQRIKEL